MSKWQNVEIEMWFRNYWIYAHEWLILCLPLILHAIYLMHSFGLLSRSVILLWSNRWNNQVFGDVNEWFSYLTASHKAGHSCITKLRVPESSPKVEDDNWDTQGRKWSLITDQQSKGWGQLISNSASRSRAESNCWSCMPQINRVCGRDCACSDWSCHLNRKDSFTWSLHQ